MKYTVNWVEKNLGVTRKTLRNYEAKGLMDKASFQNHDNKYREYSDEDIERIWCYRLLQGVGYSVKEIVDMTQNGDFDIQTSLSEKIRHLESKKSEIEQYIGFAKSLKLTGTFPLPKEMGSIGFEEFRKYARKYWNVDTDPQMSTAYEFLETMLNKPESERSETELEQMVTILSGVNFDLADIYKISEYYTELVRLKELDASNIAVQTLVNLLYGYYCEHIFPEDVIVGMTSQKFAIYIVRLFTVGDVSVINEKIYGKDGCKFISEALAYFGGYSSVNDIDWVCVKISDRMVR